MNRVTADARSSVAEIILQSKSTPAQKRALLLKKGLLRTTVDELEILSEVGPWIFILYLISRNNAHNHVRGGYR